MGRTQRLDKPRAGGGGYVHALAIDTATPTRLYTGTDGGGVFAIEQVDVCVGDCTIDGSVSVDDVIT